MISAMILTQVLGAMAGLFHRFHISPRIGQHRRKTQSVGTPTAGVLINGVAYTIALWSLAKALFPDRQDRNLCVIAGVYAYNVTFLWYGAMVVITMLLKIGGVKK